jgi:hypothetical protein
MKSGSSNFYAASLRELRTVAKQSGRDCFHFEYTLAVVMDVDERQGEKREGKAAITDKQGSLYLAPWDGDFQNS